jgi:pimeloyl-ACP methyl ester carboxylesterase
VRRRRDHRSSGLDFAAGHSAIEIDGTALSPLDASVFTAILIERSPAAILALLLMSGSMLRTLSIVVTCCLLTAGGTLQAQAASCAITTHSEKIGNGTIVYNEVGSGPDILLIHGLFAEKEQWNGLACLLAEAGFTAIAVDLPGYGKSQVSALADYALEREVENLHALVARLHISEMDVAGNSMGGAIASLYAGRYPGQVRSLAFLGSPQGITRWGKGVADAIYGGINPFIPVTVAQLDLEFGLLFVKPPQIPLADRKRIIAGYVARNRHYVQIWNIVNLYDDVLAHHPPAKTPTLIVWGDDDRIFDVAGAQSLQSHIPGSELHLLPHAGHLLHLEDAAEVAPIYVDFLKAAASRNAASAAGNDPSSAGQPAATLP